MQQSIHAPADLWTVEPVCYRIQQPAANEIRYITVRQSVTSHLINRHIAGEITLSASAIGRDQQSVFGGYDIDEGGVAAIRYALLTLADAGIAAIGIAYGPSCDGHDGGMVYVRSEPMHWQRIHTLLDGIRADAALPAEVLPSNKPYRLPFGIHRRAAAGPTRGQLVTQDGEIIDLDQNGWLDQAAPIWRTLRRVTADQCPMVAPAEQTTPPPAPGRRTGATRSSDLIGQYLATITEADVIDLLERTGARLARSNGRTLLLHCGCPNHNHGDKHPSLEIQLATRDERRGFNIVGHAPGCIWHAERGRTADPGNVLLHIHHGNWRSANAEMRQRIGTPPTPPTLPTLTPPSEPVPEAPAPEHVPTPKAAPEPTLKAAATAIPAAPPTTAPTSLRAFIEANGSAGVVLLNIAYEQCGCTDPTTERLQAAVKRLRGKPYGEGHYYRLARERKDMIARWEAELGSCADQNDQSRMHIDGTYHEYDSPLPPQVVPEPSVVTCEQKESPCPPKADPPRRTRQPLPADPTERRAEQNRRRRERERARFEAMSDGELAGEIRKLRATSRKADRLGRTAQAQALADQAALAERVQQLRHAPPPRPKQQGLDFIFASTNHSGFATGDVEIHEIVSAPPHDEECAWFDVEAYEARVAQLAACGWREAWDVAVGHTDAVVTELQSEQGACSFLIDTTRQDGFNECSSVGRAQRVHVATVSREFEGIAGGSDLGADRVFDAALSASAPSENAVIVLGNAVEDGRIAEPRNDAGAATFAVLDGDLALLAVDVAGAKPHDLADAEAGVQRDVSSQAGLAAEMIEQLLAFIRRPAVAWPVVRARCADGYVRHPRCGRRPPAPSLEAVFELVQRCADRPGAGDPASLAVSKIRGDVIVGDVAQFADLRSVVLDPRDSGNAALLVGAPSAVRVDQSVGSSRFLRGVATLADARNRIQRIDHLVIEASPFRHWWPPW